MKRIRSWRVALRLAQREIGRNKGRSSLIALLVALPVLAASIVSVVYQSQTWEKQDELRADLGAAQARIYWQALNPIEQSPDGGGTSSNSRRDKTLESLTSAEYGEWLAERIPAGDRLIPERWLWTNDELLWKGESLGVMVRELDYTDAGIEGLVEQVSGRAPAAAGEVVVSENLGRHGVSAGDTLTYQASADASPVTLKVVGEVDGYNSSGQNTIIGMPGTLLPARPFDLDKKALESYDGSFPAVEWLVAGPQPVTWDLVQELNAIGSVVHSRDVILDPPSVDLGFETESAEATDLRGAVIVAVLAGLALLQVALLAGPAIAVGARRNQRSLALMASAGAERRHLRAAVLAVNGLIGLVGSVVGAGLGAVAGVLVIVGVRQWTDIDIIRIDVHPTDLLALVLAGTGTTVAAALIPALQVSRMNVVSTLTGRRTRGSAPARVFLPALGLIVAVGGLALAVQTTRGFIADPVKVVVGLALFEVGLVMTAGTVVAVAARLARPLPFSLRFALRDASRQRSRTAPAVAAVLAAVAGGTAGLVYFASAEEHNRIAYTGTGDFGVVTVIGRNDTTVPRGVENPSLDRAEATLTQTLGTERSARYQVLDERINDQFVQLELAYSQDDRCLGSIGPYPSNPLPACYWQDQALAGIPGEFFDDGTALAELTGGRSAEDVAQLKAGKVVVSDPSRLWPDNTVRVLVHRYEGDDGNEARAPEPIALPAVLASGELRLRSALFPVAVAEQLGVELNPGGLVAKSPRALTEQDAEALSASLRSTGEVFEVAVERGYQSENSYWLSILALLVAAGVVSLIGTFTAVGLAAAESRPDLSTLAAVGADPGLRRRLTAAQGGVIAGLGTVLGIGSGALAGYVLVRLARPAGVQFSESRLWELVIPWPYLLTVGLGLPLLAMLIGFLTARAQLPMIRRVGQ